MGINSSSPSSEMSGAVTNAIRQRISQNTVVIISKEVNFCLISRKPQKILIAGNLFKNLLPILHNG